VAMVEQEVA